MVTVFLYYNPVYFNLWTIANMLKLDGAGPVDNVIFLFQIRTAASWAKAESICLFTTSLSFRVQRKIGPFLKCNKKSFFFSSNY
jgi:hypothetical protein